MDTLLIAKLVNKFYNDFKTILEDFNQEDQIYFTESMVKYTQLHKTSYHTDYSLISDVYKELLKKLRSKLKKAYELQLWGYYDPLMALVQKGIITTEEFNNSDIQGFSNEDFLIYISYLLRLLDATKDRLYLTCNEEPDHDKSAEIINMDKEYTTARQALAMYFLLKSLKCNVDSPAKVRFINFFTGKSPANITKAILNPFNKTGKEQGKDLRYIKSYFVDLQLPEIVKHIDEELNLIRID